MLEIWLPLLGFTLIGWAWYHVLRLREHATSQARLLCERHGLQLLDDSVALHRLRVDRRRSGWRVAREYRFETSRGGNDRQAASFTVLRGRVVGARMPAAERVEQPAAMHVIRMPPHVSTPTAAVDAGTNVIPIERARRTLH